MLIGLLIWSNVFQGYILLNYNNLSIKISLGLSETRAELHWLVGGHGPGQIFKKLFILHKTKNTWPFL